MPTVAEAIDAIHAAGGVAVWAHPFWDVDAGDEVVRAHRPLRRARASTASRPSTSRTPRSRRASPRPHCAERGLLTTGSADFHGPDHPRFHAFRAFDLFGIEPDLGPIRSGMA